MQPNQNQPNGNTQPDQYSPQPRDYADLPAPSNTPATNTLGQQAIQQTPVVAPTRPVENYQYGAQTTSTPGLNSKSRLKRFFKWFGILLLIGLVGAGGYFAYSVFLNPPSTTNQQPANQLSPSDAAFNKILETQLSLTNYKMVITDNETELQATKTYTANYDVSTPADPKSRGIIRYDYTSPELTGQSREANFIFMGEGKEEYWRLVANQKPVDKTLASVRGEWIKYLPGDNDRIVPVALYEEPGQTARNYNTVQSIVPIGNLSPDRREIIKKLILKEKPFKVLSKEDTSVGGRPSSKFEIIPNMDKLNLVNKRIAELLDVPYVVENERKVSKLTVWADSQSSILQQLEITYEDSDSIQKRVYSNINQAVIIEVPQNVKTQAEALAP